MTSEKEWQATVVTLLKLRGWAVYHTFDSRRSEAGFPDLIALRGPRLLAIECKTRRGRATPSQLEWLTAFSEVRDVDAFILRPAADLSELEELVA